MFFRSLRWAMLWALVILILCGMPGRDIPHISFLELLSFDKFVHAGIFFVLTFLTIRGFVVQTSVQFLHDQPKTMAVLICVLYGGFLEIMQGTIFEERSADVFDFIANSFGCIVALVCYSGIEKKFLKNLIK
jgi:VanZ family protein